MADEETAGAAPKAARAKRKIAARQAATVEKPAPKKPTSKKPAAKAKPEVLPDPTNWIAVKRRYQNNRKMNVKEIAEHFKIEPKRLREIAHERGWRRPSSRRLRPKKPETLPERLLEVVDGQLTQLELQMEDGLMPDSPEATRQVRNMHQVVRTYPQKPGAAEGAPERAASGPSKAGDTDAERWRLDLAERIKKLKQKLEAL